MRVQRVAILVVALLGGGAANVAAQELVVLRDIPDLLLYSATTEELRDPIPPRYRVGVGYTGWLTTSSHADDETDQELSVAAVFGARLRPDRFVQGRTQLAGLDTARGDHRLRIVYGLGKLTEDRVGPIVETDLTYRHGDPNRTFGAATEPGLDASRASALVRGWIADRKRLCGCLKTLLFPVGYRYTHADFTALDRTTSTARVQEVSSGVGSRFGDEIHVDGWWEWIGVSAARIEIDSPAPLAICAAEPAGPSQASLTRIDLRLANVNDVVLYERRHFMTTHRIGLGHTWLWNRVTGRDADIVTGTYSGTIKFASGTSLGIGFGRNVRLADTSDRYHTETRIEARADVGSRAMGGSARLSASYNTPLGIVNPTDAESFWSEAIHTKWHIGMSNGLTAGLQHVADLRYVPTGSREWTHYLGAFVSFAMTSDDPGMLR